jgi:hypothetical protein
VSATETEATRRLDALVAEDAGEAALLGSSAPEAGKSECAGSGAVEDAAARLNVGPEHVPVAGSIHMDAMAFGMGW